MHVTRQILHCYLADKASRASFMEQVQAKNVDQVVHQSQLGSEVLGCR